MDGHEEPSNHIVLSPTIFALLLGSTLSGGAGLYGFVQPELEKEAIRSCFNNSQTALQVAAQHGEEIKVLRSQLLERTQYRYTSEDAARDRGLQREKDTLQNRRIQFLEDHVAAERREAH
jgi:hypothetical protein